MNKILLRLRKSIMIFLCIAVLIGVYYFVMIRPFDEFWEESKKILSGELQPDKSHPLWIDYRLDGGKPYSLATYVKLDIKRSFVWRLGNHGGMTVMYSQEYYDKDGNLLTKDQVGAERWTLEKIDGRWTITVRYLPNL